jgi:hypothetical protein
MRTVTLTSIRQVKTSCLFTGLYSTISWTKNQHLPASSWTGLDWTGLYILYSISPRQNFDASFSERVWTLNVDRGFGLRFVTPFRPAIAHPKNWLPDCIGYICIRTMIFFMAFPVPSPSP